MFEVGFTEILMILGIGLLVLGPEKLPKVAGQIGRWAGRARAMARNLKDQLDEEVLRAEQNYSRPAPPDHHPPTSPNLQGPPDPVAEVAAGAAGIAAAGSAAAAPVADHDPDAHLPAGDAAPPPVTAAPFGESPPAATTHPPATDRESPPQP